MSTPVNSNFEYQTLPDEHDLRILRIDSATESTLKCHLLSEPFQDAQKRGYYALSYCWGDEPFEAQIKIDGSPFSVKPNALRALNAVYSWLESAGLLKKGECRIWIDAICINQNDNAEKSIQVQRMDQVYSHARHTLIWLGAAKDDSDRIVSVLSHAGWKSKKSRSTFKDQIGRSFKNLIDSHERDHQKRLAKELESKYSVSKSQIDAFADLIEKIEIARPVEAWYRSLFARKDDPLPFSPQDSFWQSMFFLFSRSWFSRIWTFQEGILTKEATVLCGKYWIEWSLFRRWRYLLVDWMTFAIVAGQIQIKTPPNTLMSASYDRGLIGDGFEALRNIFVFDSSTRQASVKKDFVYGYLGIIGNALSESITIDYDAPDWTVFAQTAKIIVEGRNGVIDWSCMLDGLPVQTSEPIQGLPSWCPDFACKGVSFVEDFYYGSESFDRMVKEHVFQKLGFEESTAVTDDLKMLTIPGYLLDTIDQTSDAVLLPCPDAGTWEQIWEQQDLPLILGWLSGLEDLCETSGLKYPDSILSFFFEKGDGDVDGPAVKTHKRLQRFQQLQSLFEPIVDITDVDELTRKFEALSTETTIFEEQNVSTELRRCVADIRNCRVYNRGRHFFTTRGGRIGFSSRKVCEGQQVCYFSGSYFLKILSAESEDINRFVGIASVEGLMDNELLRLCSEPDREKTFHIY